MNIIELTRQAGFTANDEQEIFLRVYREEIERFAALVRNATLEECASEFEGQYTDSCPGINIAAAIRALKENIND